MAEHGGFGLISPRQVGYIKKGRALQGARAILLYLVLDPCTRATPPWVTLHAPPRVHPVMPPAPVRTMKGAALLGEWCYGL